MIGAPARRLARRPVEPKAAAAVRWSARLTVFSGVRSDAMSCHVVRRCVSRRRFLRLVALSVAFAGASAVACDGTPRETLVSSVPSSGAVPSRGGSAPAALAFQAPPPIVSAPASATTVPRPDVLGSVASLFGSVASLLTLAGMIAFAGWVINSINTHINYLTARIKELEADNLRLKQDQLRPRALTSVVSLRGESPYATIAGLQEPEGIQERWRGDVIVLDEAVGAQAIVRP
jgi:hypothetical protein